MAGEEFGLRDGSSDIVKSSGEGRTSPNVNDPGRSPYDAWGRIKVGKARGYQSTPSRPASANHDPGGLSTKESSRISPNYEARKADPVLPAENQRLSNGDETIVWTDPATTQRLRLNARTGFVVANHDSVINQEDQGDTGAIKGCSSAGESLPKLKTCPSKKFLKPKPGTWAEEFIGNWENPVFQRTEEQIPCVTIDEDSFDKILRGHKTKIPGLGESFNSMQESRLSKRGLEQADIIAQVDTKFILARFTNTGFKEAGSARDGDVLVLIDQHAADERIKVEQLLESLCKKPSANTESIQTEMGLRSAIETCLLTRPIIVEINAKEGLLLQRCAPYFSRWGVLYNFRTTRRPSDTGRMKDSAERGCVLEVLTLPPSIAERCRTEPKLLVDLLRSEAWKCQTELGHHTEPVSTIYPSGTASWVRQPQGCPQAMIDMINSRAFRSAIMFNDKLSLEGCVNLVRTLSRCSFPFQCAHGRPSMIPLLNLGTAQESPPGDPGARGLGGQWNHEGIDINRAWTAWSGHHCP